jgi:hypothetical protein
VPTVAKGIVKLVGSRDLASLRSALGYLEPCAGSLEVLSDACMGPAVMAISLIPKIGNIIGFVCTQSSNIVAKFRSAQQRVDSGLAVVASESDIVTAVEAPAAAAAARRALLSSSSSLIRASTVVSVHHSLDPVHVSFSFQSSESRQLLGMKDRKEARQDKREEKKEERKENREERKEVRVERKEERQENRQERKEERQENRQERKDKREDRKKNRKKLSFNPLNIFLKKVCAAMITAGRRFCC